MGQMVGAHIFDFAEPDVSAILWHVPSFLRAHRAHNSLYEPYHFYARKTMLQRFNFANFSGDSYHNWGSV